VQVKRSVLDERQVVGAARGAEDLRQPVVGLSVRVGELGERECLAEPTDSTWV